jgi:2-phospho-L-lactate/phosphoenolpyruvate guanylyltransferase
MRTAAVLPVKRFARAKQRLGASIDEELRLALAGAMVADVMRALAETDALASTILVTAEPSLRALAAAHGAILVEDELECGQSAAAALGVRWALGAGIERVLCVPGDCPALDPRELGRLLAPPRGGSSAEVVIVPDRHGTGTNGLLLSPPDAIAPSFGPGSCERHRRLAADAGLPCRLAQTPSLLLDIDTGADLAMLRERLAGRVGRARSTRAVLGRDEAARAPLGAPA